MKQPKIVIFINKGSVEAVYADTYLLDIEIVECRDNSCIGRFDKHYEKAEREGLSEICTKNTVVNVPWYGDGEDDV